MNKRLWMVGAVLVFLSACADKTDKAIETSANGTEPLRIYTSIFPLEDWTKRIGGDYVDVKNLIPSGVDAHTYELTAQDMVTVADADAFIYNGAGLEAFAEKVIDTVSSHDVKVVEAIDGIDLLAHTDDHDDHDHDHEHEHGDQNPHVWLDPILAIDMAENVKELLVQLMPEQENFFIENYEELVRDLKALDQDFTELMANANHDTMMVSHAGYGYWEARYGVKQMSIAGLSPTSEPSQRDLAETVRMAEEKDLAYVLVEPNIASRVTQVVQQELGVDALPIYNLEGLTKEQEEAGEDYFSLMKQNIETLRLALAAN